jgi:hypothetical protein
MQFRLRTLLIVTVGVVALVGYAAYSWRTEAAQNVAVDAFSTAISLGMPRSQVDQMCEATCAKNQGWRHWLEAKHLGSSVAIVQSPVAFGATNHVVYIVFDKDVVAAVLVRTLDTTTQRPSDAPQDRVANASFEVLKEFKFSKR